MRIFLFSILILLQLVARTAWAFEPFVLEKIEIKGVQKVSRETILDEASSYVGKNFTNQDANALIKQIFKTGYFADVKLSNSNKTLVIIVTERPSIAKLQFTGTKKSKELEEILAEFDIVEGRVFNSSAMRKAEKKIQQFFASQKRFSVSVSSKVIELPRNRVEVQVIVSEGVIPEVKEIKLFGNKAFTTRQILKELNTSTRGLFSWYTKAHEYSREKLDADLETIKSYYKDRGYLHIAIESTQVSLSNDKSQAYVAIYLSEGERYYFTKPYLDGTFPIPKEEITKAVNEIIIPGQPFSDKKIWQAKEQIDSLLGDKGYSKADVRVMTDVEEDKKLVKIGYFVNPGKQITVRKINIVGNTLTKDKVVRREIEQYEGSTISTTKLKEAKESLMRRGYAKSVDIDTTSIPGVDDQTDLWIKIVEQKNSQASASIGYTTAGGGITGQIGLKTMNFLGSGMDVGVSGLINRVSKAASLSFFDPYFTKSGVGFGVSFFYRRTNLSKGSDVMDYVTDSAGINLNWQWRLSQYMTYNIGTGFSTTSLHLNRDASPLQAIMFADAYSRVSSFKEYTVSNSITYNSLDTPVMTNKGFYANLGLTVSVPGSNLRTYQVDFDQAYFKPIYKDILIYNFKTELGFIDTYGLSRNRPFPFFKNYYMGGPDTVRGFKENGVGPLDSKGKPFGANASILIRNQILFPPPFFEDVRSVRFALFFDAGQVYYTRQNGTPVLVDENGKKTIKVTSKTMNPTGLRYTAGLSVTWHTPFGVPLGFSVAKPVFNKRKSDADFVEVFTFSLGTEMF